MTNGKNFFEEHHLMKLVLLSRTMNLLAGIKLLKEVILQRKTDILIEILFNSKKLNEFKRVQMSSQNLFVKKRLWTRVNSYEVMFFHLNIEDFNQWPLGVTMQNVGQVLWCTTIILSKHFCWTGRSTWKVGSTSTLSVNTKNLEFWFYSLE